MSNEWRPATAAEVEAIVADDLSRCSPDERALFEFHRVPFYQVPIRRFDKVEGVYVVARFDERVLYFEDVEEGFALSTLDQAGAIPEPDCSQFALSHVLYAALQGEDELGRDAAKKQR